jgi:hypothetical protein
VEKEREGDRETWANKCFRLVKVEIGSDGRQIYASPEVLTSLAFQSYTMLALSATSLPHSDVGTSNVTGQISTHSWSPDVEQV